jgi:hypothetical protein
MLEFDSEKAACDSEPGLVPKLITFAGLAMSLAWVLRLIFC